MRKLIMTVALLTAITASAQRGGGKGFGSDLSAEELATLKTKKMTLALVLDQKQSDKVYNVVLDQVKDRKAMVAAHKAKGEKPKLSKDERFIKMNTRLDKHIAVQNEMKAILTDSQFEQYQKMQAKRKKGNKQGQKREHRARK